MIYSETVIIRDLNDQGENNIRLLTCDLKSVTLNASEVRLNKRNRKSINNM